MEAQARKGMVAIVAIAMLAVLLAGQAAADRLTADVRRASTGELMGRTGFAYLTSIRAYVADVLWARLDPVNDDYYQSVSLKNKKFLVPTIRLVTWLNPQMEEPYYDGTLIVWENDLPKDAERMALEGVQNIPNSGWMHANYAQLLIFEKRYADAARQADLAMKGYWADPGAKYNMTATLEIAYRKTNQPGKATAVVRERGRLHDLLGLPAGGTLSTTR